MPVIALLAALAVAALAAAPAAATPRIAAPATAAVTEPCGPTDARATTLVRSSSARVYRYRERSSGRGFVVQACVAGADDQPIRLDNGVDMYAFLPPAMSLTGTILGYAVTACDFSASGEGCDTLVIVEDLTRTDATGVLYRGRASTRRVVKVGSLRAMPTGAVAWIACPERARETELRATRSPTCVRPGNLDTVFVASPQRQRRAVSTGRRIDPSSLRRSGSRVTWRERGRRRAARLR